MEILREFKFFLLFQQLYAGSMLVFFIFAKKERTEREDRRQWRQVDAPCVAGSRVVGRGAIFMKMDPGDFRFHSILRLILAVSGFENFRVFS